MVVIASTRLDFNDFPNAHVMSSLNKERNPNLRVLRSISLTLPLQIYLFEVGR